jgi:hypothetical protein
MRFPNSSYAETPVAGKAPRVYAPAESRIRKDATPWDADLLASCSRHSRAAEAVRQPGDRSLPAERR